MRPLKKLRFGNHLLRRAAKNPRLRLCVTLLFSLIFHTSYAVFQLASGLYYRQQWLYALALYYALLTAMRLTLLRHLAHREAPGQQEKELKLYRLCGIMLTAMTPALITLVALLARAKRPLVYHGLSTLITALYTVTAFGAALFGIRRYRDKGSPLLSAAKAVSLTTASVALLSLEISLLFTFGNPEDLAFRRIVTALSGGAVCLFVLALSLHMIRRAGRALRFSPPPAKKP